MNLVGCRRRLWPPRWSSEACYQLAPLPPHGNDGRVYGKRAWIRIGACSNPKLWLYFRMYMRVLIKLLVVGTPVLEHCTHTTNVCVQCSYESASF